MDLFGIGAMELLLILVLALIVMGPRQLPQAARKLATLLRDLRRMWTELSTDFARELNVEEAMGGDLRTITDTVNSLRRRPSPANLLGGLVGGDPLVPPGRPPSPASLLGGLVGSDPLVPPGAPPSPAKVLFGGGSGSSAKPPAKAAAAAQKTVSPKTAPPPQAVAVTPQETAPVPQDAAPAPQEVAPVLQDVALAPKEAVPAPQAAAVQADDVLEGDAGSDV